MKHNQIIKLCSWVIVAGSCALTASNARGQNYGTCNSDNNKPSIACLQASASWTDTAHCVYQPSSTTCINTTGTVTHHDDTITWSGSNVRVGGYFEPSEEGDIWVWNDPPSGCVQYVGQQGNYQIWAVWTPTESDKTSQVQGATCATVKVGY